MLEPSGFFGYIFLSLNHNVHLIESTCIIYPLKPSKSAIGFMIDYNAKHIKFIFVKGKNDYSVKAASDVVKQKKPIK